MKSTHVHIGGFLTPTVRRRMFSESEKATFLSQNLLWKRYCALSPEEQRYCLSHLPEHVAARGNTEQLSRLLTNMNFLCLKLAEQNIEQLQRDYDCWQGPSDHLVELVKQALHLAAPILTSHPTQLPEQLCARLPDEARPFIHEVSAYKQTSWLRPLDPTLTQPGGTALRTIPLSERGLPAALALTPDGRQVIVATGNVFTCLDLSSATTLSSRTGGADDITDLAVTCDGQYVVAAARNGTLTIWRPGPQEQLSVLPAHERAALAVEPLAGSCVMTASTDGTLKRWESADGQELCRLYRPGEAHYCVAVLDEGSTVITGSESPDAGAHYYLSIWDIQSGQVVASFGEHAWPVQALAVVGRWIVAAANELLTIWDRHTHEQLHHLQAHDSFITRIQGVGTHSVISASNDGTLKLWDLPTGENTLLLRGHYTRVSDVAVTSDGQMAVSVGWDQTLRLWDLRQRAEEYPEGHRDAIERIIVSPCGTWVVTAAKDRCLKIWESASRTVWRTLRGHTHWVCALAMSPGGEWLASASWDRTIKIWSFATGLEEDSLSTGEDPVSALVLHPLSTVLIGGTTKGMLMRWDLKTHALLDALPAHDEGIQALALTPDGTSLFSVSTDRTLKQWDVETGKLRWSLQGYEDIPALTRARSDMERLFLQQTSSERMTDMVVTHDGARAITGAWNGFISIWDIRHRRLETSFKNSTCGISALCISADDAYLAAATGLPYYQSDNTLRVWDLNTRSMLASFVGDAPITACTFASTPEMLIAGDQHGRVFFLRLCHGNRSQTTA